MPMQKKIKYLIHHNEIELAVEFIYQICSFYPELNCAKKPRVMIKLNF